MDTMDKVYNRIFSVIEEEANIGGWWINVKTNEVGWTNGTRRIHDTPEGFTPTLEQAIDFYLPEYQKVIAGAVSNAIDNNTPFNIDSRIKSAKGATKWVNAYGIAQHHEGEAIYVFGVFRDIQSDIKHQEMLSVAERRNLITINSLLEGIVTIDRNGFIETFNHAAEKMFGYSANDVIGRTVDILMPRVPHGKNHHKYIDAHIKTGINKIIGIGRELEAIRKDGSTFPIHLSVNEIKLEDDIGFVGTIRDLSSEKEHAERLKWATLYDEITGLPNRTFLVEYLTEKSFPAGVTLVALDIDAFSRINLASGYEEGNIVLAEAAKRISATIGDKHFLARDLADRFWLCLNNHHLYSITEIDEILLEIFAAIKKPIHSEHSEHFIQMTAGISSSDKDIPATTFISQAEAALYEAKKNSRGRSFYYQKKQLDNLLFEYNLEKKLRIAIDNQEIECWLQPKVDSSGKIVSAEVLSRWNIDGKFIPPDVFIGVAEKMGVIEELGAYVADKTAAMLQELNKDYPTFKLAMNVSPKQFLSSHFDDEVSRIFTKNNADITNLTIEITENLLINNVKEVNFIINSLHNSGVKISIDDFGTGYSNLKRIMELPVSEIKVDKNFILDVTTSEKSSTLVLAICQIARSMNASIVAEGVENEEISQWCVANNIDYQQGYHFSKPIPFDEFLKII